MSFTSAYPKTFDRLLRFKDSTYNASADDATNALYATFDIWIKGAFEVVRGYCNQVIQAETGKVYTFPKSSLIDDTGDSFYLLPVLKTTFALTSVGYKQTPFDTVTVIDPANYTLVNDNGLLKLYFLNSVSYNYVYVTANVGYSDTDMPEPIHRVIVEMCAEIYSESDKGKGRLGNSSQAESLQTVSGTTAYYELTERHKKLLRPYTLQIV